MIFLGLPCTDSFVVKALGGLLHASQKQNVQLATKYSSNLTDNFNQLWCQMLNGEPRAEYFAMMHSDLEVPLWWIDTLVEELENNQLDVVSAVIPIKNDLRVTSTAMLDPENKEQMVYRLTYDDVKKLPKTFVAEDVKEKVGKKESLLLNTGCWGAKVGDWCREFPGFVTNSVVRYMEKTKKYEAMSFTEDWAASVWFNQKGLKIGATTAIVPTHYGINGWNINN
jgi:hypothetical protein